jgi:pimeloyl-ACP methyl ester carboxylesterase
MLSADRKLASELLGAGRLAVDAVAETSEIAEGLHHAIVTLGGILSDEQPAVEGAELRQNKRTRGISGLVYRSIRQVNGVVGYGIDAMIPFLNQTDTGTRQAPGRAAAVSALNGVLGDHLQRNRNPLAIQMAFCRDGVALDYTDLKALLASEKRIALFIHGLCMNDQQWTRRDHNHGKTLASDLGFTPLYLRYNTGLHTSQNGRALSALLAMLSECGQPDTEFYIVAHSMGGLVTRSACHYADEQAQCWLSQVQKIVFLGTPHHGAALERGGNWIDVLLESTPYSSPFSRLARIRSSGITDLRYGNVIDDDWIDGDRFDRRGDTRVPISLPERVACYAIAATTSIESNPIANNIVGDGLVSVNSAFGHHKDPNIDLGFRPDRQWLGQGINHMDLLNHPAVYGALKAFLG